MTTATSKSNHKICWQQAIYTYAHSHTHTHGQSNMQCIISVLSYATPMRPLRLIKFKSECFLVTQIAKQTNSPKRNKKMPDSLPPSCQSTSRPLLPSCHPWQIVKTTQCPPVRFSHTPTQRFIAKRWPAQPLSASNSRSREFLVTVNQHSPTPHDLISPPARQHCSASWRRKTANILTHTRTHTKFV